MNRDKPLNSMQNMLKISREYTHNYQYKGVTTYENSFPSLQVFGFFQTLEKLNEKLYQILMKNKASNLQIINNSFKNSEDIDVKCMATIKVFKEELQSFLKNKDLTREQLNKPQNSDSINMDFNYQIHASQFLTGIRGTLLQFEKGVQDIENVSSFINFKKPEDLYIYELELENLYKNLESSTETLIKFNEKFNENNL